MRGALQFKTRTTYNLYGTKENAPCLNPPIVVACPPSPDCFLVTTVGISACSRAPFTNRLQLNLVPDPLMNQLGSATYVEMLGGTRVERKARCQDTKECGATNLEGRKEAKLFVALRPHQRRRHHQRMVPSWKIVFYSGILPVLENEAGMARDGPRRATRWRETVRSASANRPP